MNSYLVVKTIHVISSGVLLGTGLGIAFFMYRAKFTENLHEKYFAARNTVIADYLFTLPAVVIQPISGVWLVSTLGYEWTEFWLIYTYILYVVIGICWIPVVWIQIQVKKIIQQSIEMKEGLPERYHQLMKVWFILGWPAFISLIAIFYLMVAKPV